MSIIERAVELLGSTSQRQRAPAAQEGSVAAPDKSVVERVIDRHAGAREGGAPDAAAATRATESPVSRARASLHRLEVDRNRLRRQSMILPDGERTPVSESFRRIKRHILANIASPKPGAPPANLVQITSALPGEGKTFCSVNLAISLALEMNRTVLLVDTDVAKSGIPKAFGFSAEKGLMDALLDHRTQLADVLWNTDIGKLVLLPVGNRHKHSTELLASDSMKSLLQELASRYPDRVVIFDSPPLLAASEAGALASQVGQVVVVVEAARTSVAVLSDALSRVDAGRITGLLLNKSQNGSLEYGYDGYG